MNFCRGRQGYEIEESRKGSKKELTADTGKEFMK